MNLNNEQIESLVRLDQATDFLKKALELTKEQHPHFGYATLSRKAGFSSRSFPRDVILGTKRLSPDSASRIAQALELRGDLKTLFLLLVKKQSLDSKGNRSRPSDESTHWVHSSQLKIEKVKNRIRARLHVPAAQDFTLIQYKGWAEIFAGLGHPEKGTLLTEISSRTGFTSSKCKSLLSEMLKHGLVRYDSKNKYYIAKQIHVILDRLGKDKFFQTSFLETVQNLLQRATHSTDSDHSLFFHSALSVNTRDLPLLKKELRETALRFVDKAESPEGDRVVKILVGLF